MFSLYLMTGLVAWLVAQGIKYLISAVKNRRSNIRQLYLSGGMPSAHSATVTALMVTVAATEGVNSAIFGVTTLLAAIVMYDAMMVRRSSGEQGAALTALMKEQKSKVPLPRVAKGHTPTEVAVGAFLGLVVAIVVIVV